MRSLLLLPALAALAAAALPGAAQAAATIDQPIAELRGLDKITARTQPLEAKVGETIQFVNFLVSSTAVLVERDKPDSVNARKVIVDYGAISAVKIADPADIARYQVLGFQPPL